MQLTVKQVKEKLGLDDTAILYPLIPTEVDCKAVLLIQSDLDPISIEFAGKWFREHGIDTIWLHRSTDLKLFELAGVGDG